MDHIGIEAVQTTRLGGIQWMVIAREDIAPRTVIAHWDLGPWWVADTYNPPAFHTAGTPPVAIPFGQTLQVTNGEEDGGYSVRSSTGLARLLNHSCNPNCGTNGYVLVTRRGVKKGDELTWDYAMSEWWDYHVFLDPATPCGCGSTNCRGRRLGFRSLLDDDLTLAQQYVSEWLVCHWLVHRALTELQIDLYKGVGWTVP